MVTLLAASTLAAQTRAPAPQAGSWRFAASGDSRNCGDVVMPTIAAGVARDRAAFYWHLGDYRKISDVDEDIAHQPEHLSKPLALPDYRRLAWQDFIKSRLVPFGPVPVFLAIGNHETESPKTREELLPQFARWFDAPVIARQRLADNPKDDRAKGYYRWIERGIAFYSLDNATPEQFDPVQIDWFERLLARDATNSSITTVVAGMHEALPDSISADHSMNASSEGTQSGRRIYADLLRLQKEGRKRVYVLASHSHYFMDGIFNTEYWRTHGGVLPGWIVGTAGAVRYTLPAKASDARSAETNVYGYLLGKAGPSGEISFEFKRLVEKDVPASVVNRYQSDFVHWCFDQNSEAR